MKRFLSLVAAFLLTALPAVASAVVPVPVPLAYGDGSFETSTPVSLPLPPAGPAVLPVPVVEFLAPTPADRYALDEVKFFLLQAPVSPATADGSLKYPVTVQIWTPAPAPSTDWILGDSLAADITVDASVGAWYPLDLKGEKLIFTGSIRIGITRRDDATAVPPPATIVPVPEMPLNLGVDTSASVSSYVYDPAAIPPAWTPDLTGNYGIQASVHLVPAMGCQGFLPPFDHELSLKRGGRTIPLKALLFDGAGAPVTRGLLAAPPLVELLYAPDAATAPIDVTDFVVPAGRSNKGQAFRGTLDGRWIYNLKTKKSLPAGIYTVQVGSGDATEYAVDPTCTGTFEIEGPKSKKGPKPKK